MDSLTDEELEAIHDVLYDQYYYGEELIYQETPHSGAVSSALWKVALERKKRRN
jgi:hypothetical protein